MLDLKQYDGQCVRVTYHGTDLVDEGYARHNVETDTLEVYDEESWNGGSPTGSWISFIQHHEDGGLLADTLGDEFLVSNIEEAE